MASSSTTPFDIAPTRRWLFSKKVFGTFWPLFLVFWGKIWAQMKDLEESFPMGCINPYWLEKWKLCEPKTKMMMKAAALSPSRCSRKWDDVPIWFKAQFLLPKPGVHVQGLFKLYHMGTGQIAIITMLTSYKNTCLCPNVEMCQNHPTYQKWLTTWFKV